jgi:hypothetical protein
MISIKPVPQNASISIRDNLELDSNVIEESDLQFEKHRPPKNSTDSGIMISIKPVPENASASTRDNLELHSNRIEESDLQ